MWTSFFRWLVSTAAGAVVGDLASERFKLGLKSLTEGGLRQEVSIIDVVGGGGSTYYGSSSILPAKRKRRRRARLTMSEIQELIQIKNILGKTAAANALPWYMGRGR